MNSTVTPPLNFESARLKLQKVRVSDAERIFESWAQDEEVTWFLTWRPHNSVQDTVAYLGYCERAWETGTEFNFLVTAKSDGVVIGNITLRIAGHRAEMGYLISRAHWRHGYAVEMVTATLKFAAAELPLKLIYATCDTENLGSAAVMEKSGMTRQGLLPKWSMHPNVSPEPRDAFFFAYTC